MKKNRKYIFAMSILIIVLSLLIYGKTQIHKSNLSIETAYANSKSIQLSDFAITNGKSLIKLDSPFKGFKINIPEEKVVNNYIGETYAGDFVYKTYLHQYKDVDLYVSNANYNLKRRTFDEYYITQITVKKNIFKTPRNITIGAKGEDVYRAYGNAKKIIQNGKTALSYTKKDMEISFVIGQKGKVEELILRIVVKDVQ